MKGIVCIFVFCLIIFISLWGVGSTEDHQHNCNSRICIIMIGDNNTREYFTLALEKNLKYCIDHRLDFHAKIGRLLPVRRYAPHYDRYAFCLDKMLLTRKYDYVLYIDSDACIQKANDAFSLDHFIKLLGNSRRSILASYDYETKYRKMNLNSGVLLFKNTKKSIAFCRSILKKNKDCHIDRCGCGEKNMAKFRDQCAIERLKEFHADFLLVNRNTLQCIAPSADELAHGKALIMHMAGSDTEARRQKMKGVCYG